jgi:cytochrome c5
MSNKYGLFKNQILSFTLLGLALGGCDAVSQTESASGAEKGKEVYTSVCSTCHAQGLDGAPKFGSKEDWGPHIAHGKETLYQHAIKGFRGTKGMMPPKGGKASLPDEDIKAAVDYMVTQAQ